MKFVHTEFVFDVIIIIVKPPNTLYSFCYTPFREIPSPKKAAYPAAFFRCMKPEGYPIYPVV